MTLPLKQIAKRKGNVTKALVAKLLGWSAGYFDRGFKKKAGISFRAKRFEIKMEIAANLLTSSGMTIEQVAAHLCYSERGNFERAFKRAYGVTPTQFRKQHVFDKVAKRKALKTDSEHRLVFVTALKFLPQLD